MNFAFKNIKAIKWINYKFLNFNFQSHAFSTFLLSDNDVLLLGSFVNEIKKKNKPTYKETLIVSTYDELSKLRIQDNELSDYIKKNQLNLSEKNMFLEERNDYLLKENDLANEIMRYVVPEDSYDEEDVVLELKAGIGGVESMLFLEQLLLAYENYVCHLGFESNLENSSNCQEGGIRSASLCIRGINAFKMFKFEAGVHCVKRVPKTDRKGRIHTSTMSIAVYPKPKKITVQYLPSEIKTDVFRSSSKGGQNVNKNETAVRLTHLPTGVMTECQEERYQWLNKKIAYQKLEFLLFKREFDASMKKLKASIRSQHGMSERSEKIRTYDFTLQHITDLRTRKSYTNTGRFFESGKYIEEITLDLLKHNYIHLFRDTLQSKSVEAARL